MFWTNEQTKALVHAWKKNLKVIESHQSLMVWNTVKEHVSKHGSKKTIDQCKKKLSNIKDAYRKSKDNNKKSGAFLSLSISAILFISLRIGQSPRNA